MSEFSFFILTALLSLFLIFFKVTTRILESLPNLSEFGALIPAAAFVRVSGRLPNLKSLNLNLSTMGDIFFVAQKCPNLEVLTTNGVNDIAAIEFVPDQFCHLTVLEFTWITVCDRFSEAQFSRFPSLRELILWPRSALTVWDGETLAKSLSPGIEFLTLNNCSRAVADAIIAHTKLTVFTVFSFMAEEFSQGFQFPLSNPEYFVVYGGDNNYVINGIRKNDCHHILGSSSMFDKCFFTKYHSFDWF